MWIAIGTILPRDATDARWRTWEALQPWANEAWGRYWNWDSIETWSLVVWLIYAFYLHLRLTMGWRGRRAVWFAVAALPLTIFAFMLVPLGYNSIHGAYLTGVELMPGR